MTADRRLGPLDPLVETEALVAVGGAAAFPDQPPDVFRHRARLAVVGRVLAQDHVAVVGEREVHVAEVGEGGDLRVAEAHGRDALVVGRQVRGDLLRDVAVGPAVVDDRQPQRHQQHPHQRGAGAREHDAAPQHLGLARDAPAHQREPAERGDQRAGEGEDLEVRFVAGHQARQVAGQRMREAGDRGQPDQPHEGAEDREAEHREPVDRVDRAALEGGQREGGEHRQRWQQQHVDAVGFLALQDHQRDQRGGHRERHGDVRPAAPALPAHPGPDRQRPGRPGEQRQVLGGVAQHRGRRAREAHQAAVQPLVEEPAGVVGIECEGGERPEREQQHGDRHADQQQVAMPDLGRGQHQHGGADDQRGGQHRVAGQQQQADRDAPPGGAVQRLVGQPYQAVDQHRDPGELGQLRGGFMAALGQPEAGQQHQQRAVGQRAAVVARLGLAAERVLERLHLGAAAEQVGGVPDEGAGHAEQHAGGDPRGVARREPGAEGLDAERAEPVAERAVRGDELADQVGQQPVVRASRPPSSTSRRSRPHPRSSMGRGQTGRTPRRRGRA